MKDPWQAHPAWEDHTRAVRRARVQFIIAAVVEGLALGLIFLLFMVAWPVVLGGR